MRPRQPDDEVPTVSSVLVAGMRELAGAFRGGGDDYDRRIWKEWGRGETEGRVQRSAVSVDFVGAAVLEDEDINEAISTPEMGSWEGVIEVVVTTSCAAEWVQSSTGSPYFFLFPLSGLHLQVPACWPARGLTESDSDSPPPSHPKRRAI